MRVQSNGEVYFFCNKCRQYLMETVTKDTTLVLRDKDCKYVIQLSLNEHYEGTIPSNE